MFKIVFWITETLLICFSCNMPGLLLLSLVKWLILYHCTTCVLRKIPTKRMKLADNI